jgi:DNA-binding phage protein
MPKNKIRYDNAYKAREIFAVLIEGERESRSYSKSEMTGDLIDPDIYAEFLKTCFEFDESEDLKKFRKGLYIVLSHIGMSEAARQTQIPRTTLYRMLWKGGNPNLKYLVRILAYLGLKMWVVSEHFVKESQTLRYKRVKSPYVLAGRARRIAKAPTSE